MKNISEYVNSTASSFLRDTYSLGKTCISSGKTGAKIGLCTATPFILLCWLSGGEKNPSLREPQIDLTFSCLFISSLSLTGGCLGFISPLAVPLLKKIAHLGIGCLLSKKEVPTD